MNIHTYSPVIAVPKFVDVYDPLGPGEGVLTGVPPTVPGSVQVCNTRWALAFCRACNAVRYTYVRTVTQS